VCSPVVNLGNFSKELQSRQRRWKRNWEEGNQVRTLSYIFSFSPHLSPLVKIYLLDNSSKTFLLTETTTSLDVIKMVLHKLEVNGINIVAPYFALYESLNGSTIDSSIPSDTILLNLMKQWTTTNQPLAKLVFMIRLYVPAVSGYTSRDLVATALGIHSSEALTLELYFQNAETTDQQLLHLQYIQCVYHVITGQYPTTAELALELGAYHFIYKFQPTEDSSYPLGFLADRIVEFIPFSHLRNANLEEWEEKLLQKVEDIRILSRAYGPVWKPQRKYLEIVMTQLPSCYGSTFFRCSQVMAIFHELPIHLYSSPDSVHLSPLGSLCWNPSKWSVLPSHYSPLSLLPW
jgi:hypothetical protein